MTSPPSSQVPIAQLGPGLDFPTDTFVHGVVTLVWPYASSTQSLSLLLVEPDFRLRRQRGQVRIHFQGSSAKAVARAHVCSGDELVLNLQGASWENDATVSTTPGRGIEWELRFGEHVIVEIQRPGQIPYQLKVDHPPLSPEPSRQASPPLSTPLHDIRIPRSIRKPHFSQRNGNDNIWSSPAFLKRSHFAATSFDPFSELEAEFPDGERKKRTKIGRGSGQWKFVEHSPNPEKGDCEAPAPENLSSPSEVMQVVSGQAMDQQATLATPPLDASIYVPEDGESPALMRNLSTEPDEDVAVEIAEHGNVGNNTISKASTPSLLEHVLVEHEGNRLSPNGFREGSPHYEPTLSEIGSNAVHAFSRDSSPSIVSSRSQSPARDLDRGVEERPATDNASEATWSGSASELGLDGAFLSRLRQTEQVMPMASEIGRRWVEMQRAANDKPKAKSALQTSEIESSESSRKGVPIENGLAPRATNDQPGSRDHQGSIPTVSAADHYPEPLDEPTTKGPNIQPDGKDVRIESLKRDERTSTDESWMKTSMSHEQPAIQKYVQVDSGAKIVEGLDSTKLDQSENIIREETPIDEKRDDKAITAATTTLHPATGMGSAIESAPPQVNVIDMKSDEEDKDDNQHSLLLTHHAPLSPIPTDMEYKGAEALDHETRSMNNGDSTLEGHETRIEQLSSGFDAEALNIRTNSPSRESITQDSMEEDNASYQEESSEIFQEEPYSDPSQITYDPLDPKTSSEPIAPRQVYEDDSYSQLPSDVNSQYPAASVDLSLPLQELPSAVPDTLEGPFTSQIPTQSDSQFPDLEPQALTQSALSVHVDETLQTPEPAQETSTTILTLDPENSEGTDHHSGQDQVSKALTRDTQAEAHDIPAMNKPVEGEGMGLQGSAAKVELPQHSALRSKPDAQASDNVHQQNPPSKGSSLIARVKEMRRLSGQTPGRRLSGSSASPWFASRRSSQAIPKGEAETDVHTSSPERVGESLTRTSPKTTPKRSEKSLSQSFIRSSPAQSSTSKSPTSPHRGSQYLPFSQVASGFRTNLSYFVPLASLHNHYGTTVDVLAIAISSTSISRAKNGAKDYNQTLYLSDPSSVGGRTRTSLTTAQIFRPRKSCFPTLNIGDAVLLRNFKVHSFQKTLSLIDTDVSAWAIFRKDADVQISGPPVEYGPEERAFARAHWNWWASLDEELRNGLTAAVPKIETSRTKKGLGFELRSSQSQQSIKPAKAIDDLLPNSPPKKSFGSDGSLGSAESRPKENKAAAPPHRVLRRRNAQGRVSASPEGYAIPEVEEIHELRDGTRYVDREGVGVRDVEAQRGVHELRDGTRYRDRVRE